MHAKREEKPCRGDRGATGRRCSPPFRLSIHHVHSVHLCPPRPLTTSPRPSPSPVCGFLFFCALCSLPAIVPLPQNDVWFFCGYFLPPLTSHFSPLTSHFSLLTSHLSLLTSHLSPLTSHFSPLTSHFSVPPPPRPMPPSRFARSLGLIHYILGLLALVGFVLAVVGMFWVWSPNPYVPGSPESNYAKFGLAVAVTTLGTVAVCFFILAPITFLLGNRLFSQRWRVFCIVMAACELLWGLFTGVILACILFAELSTAQSTTPIRTSLIILLSSSIPTIPLALSIITITFLSLSSTGAAFQTLNPSPD
jgi:hypothetical protein